MKKNSILLSAAVVIIFCVCIAACDQIFSQAKGEVSNFKSKNDFGLINDSLDYGVTVKFDVKNIGKSGIITITPKLSCSEGEWTREQKVSFNEGQTKSFSYFFPEPTINATNIYSSVDVYPSSDK